MPASSLTAAERSGTRRTPDITHAKQRGAHFDDGFKARVQAALDRHDEAVDAVMFHCDNFHGLHFAQARLSGLLKCIYIDPPYNTGSSAILYKNGFRHSSWCTLLRDRLALAKCVMKTDGAVFVSIDKTERNRLEHALHNVFGEENHIEELIWTQATANSQLPNYSTNHEYVEVYCKDRAAVEADSAMFREPKPGFSEVRELVAKLNPSFPPCAEIETAIKDLYQEHLRDYGAELKERGLPLDNEAKRKDPWRGIYAYLKAEYRTADGQFVEEEAAKELGASIWVWSSISAAAPASKQSPTTKDPHHPNYRFYNPTHPETGMPCEHPRSGWKFPKDTIKGEPSRRSFSSLQEDRRIAWGKDHTTVPRTKGYLHEVETNIGTSVFYAYNDGEAELSSMFGESGLFLSPKSSQFVQKFIVQTTGKNDWFMDFFGGSGSSGHAIISQNREDHGRRKFVLIEMGDHFDNLLVPRVKKAVYSSTWRGGVPIDRDGQSFAAKYVRLESYEDVLNNLELQRSNEQSDLLSNDDDLREQYLLSYMLDVESRGSQSLLNVDSFRNPDDYKLKVERNGETQLVKVDIVETFNWLLGLAVKHFDNIRGVRVIEGTNPDGERVLVLWRNLDETDNDALDTWFKTQDYNTRDQDYDAIYVNGDNNLENLRRADQTWKVRLTEEHFHRLMFEDWDT